MMGIAFWLGLFWRRMTPTGAWAATLISFAFWFGTSRIAFGGFVLWDFNAHGAPYLPGFMVWNGSLHLPWQMVLYLAAGLLGGVTVSLLSRPVPESKLDHFYALLRTPVKPGEQVAIPCTLAQDAVVPPRRNLFRSRSLEIPVPSVTGMAGFLAGWICVALLVLVVYIMAQP
jgi:hypothetical protein